MKNDIEELAYRIYMSDRAYAMTQCSGTRYAEYIGIIKTDTHTGDEVAADVIKRAGLVVK